MMKGPRARSGTWSGVGSESGFVKVMTDPDPGGPKTYGFYGFWSGSVTLDTTPQRNIKKNMTTDRDILHKIFVLVVAQSINSLKICA